MFTLNFGFNLIFKLKPSSFLADQIEDAFYDDMNMMARRMGMLKALITTEDEARRRSPAPTSARGVSTAVRDAIKQGTDSD